MSVNTTYGPFFNFNSIKVQLKQKACIEAAYVFKFQFHKGTIKTISSTSCISNEYISIP